LSTDGLPITEGKWQASIVTRFLNNQSHSNTVATRFYFGFLTMKAAGWDPVTDPSDGVLSGAFFSVNSQRMPYLLRCTVVNNGVVSGVFQTAVSPNTAWHNYAVVGDATGGSWQFWYDGALLTTISGVVTAPGVVDAPYNTTQRPRIALRYFGTRVAAGDLGKLVDALYYKYTRNTPLALKISYA